MNTVIQFEVFEEASLAMVNVLLIEACSTIKIRKTDLTNSMAANKARHKRMLNNNPEDKEELTRIKSKAE